MSGDRSIFDLNDPQIFLLTARSGDAESGMIATWVYSATLRADRPRVIAALSPSNYTAQLIQRSGRFVAHLLAEDQAELIPLFGLRSGREVDKFAPAPRERSPGGLPLIAGCCGWIECHVVDQRVAGDRIVFVAGGGASRLHEGRKPLTLSTAYARLPADVGAACRAQQERDGARDAPLP